MKSSTAKIPQIIYATAMKRAKTKQIVSKAISQGFRAIDTANQLYFNNESGVGQALQTSNIARNQLFIQTKFASPKRHQKIKVPYDQNLKLQEQVKISFQMSLKNLKTDYIDSFLLYGALKSMPRFFIVWKIFQQLVKKQKVKYIGVANCYDIQTLKNLYKQAKIKPKFIQNRFFRSTGYDKQIRKFCNQNNIIYQSFDNISSNPHVLQSKQMETLTKKYNKTAIQILYRTLIQMNIIPLTGTISSDHMKENLSIFQFQLEKQDFKLISNYFQ